MTDAIVSSAVSDLAIEFGPCRLEVFNDSSGYEGWTLAGPDGETLIAQGGGHLVRHKASGPDES